MILQLSTPGGGATARRIPVDVALDIIAGLGPDVRICIRPDDGVLLSGQGFIHLDDAAIVHRSLISELRQANRERALLRQLVSEALACIDEHDPDYDIVDRREWIKVARQMLRRL